MMQDQAPQEGQAPAEGQEGGDPAEAIAGIASTVNEGLQMLSQALGQIKGPEVAKQLQAITQAFQKIVGEAMGGAGGEGQAPADGGMDSPEAGGNPNARPAAY
jgi:hypothetical protein